MNLKSDALVPTLFKPMICTRRWERKQIVALKIRAAAVLRVFGLRLTSAADNRTNQPTWITALYW